MRIENKEIKLSLISDILKILKKSGKTKEWFFKNQPYISRSVCCSTFLKTTKTKYISQQRLELLHQWIKEQFPSV